MRANRRLPKTISEQLRWHILRSGESTYALEKATGVSNASVGRFLRGERGLNTASVDALCAHLGLKLARADE